MPRIARKKSSTGIYHAILRGINKQTIFADEEDNIKFLQVLEDCKKVSGFKIYCYCLMGNHVHLLIKEEKEPVEKIFRRIGARYVFWYNYKYKRSGHLFQDRFKSEAVEDDEYFMTVLRYILQNPRKAGIVKNGEAYEWSSYNDFAKEKGLTDIEFAIDIFGSKKALMKFIAEQTDDKALDINEKLRLTDTQLTEKIYKKYKIKAVMIQNEPKDKMIGLLREILKIDGVSTRQLARVTGISPNIIWKL